MNKKFKQTDIGEIPEDWNTGTLENIAIFKNGKASPERRDDAPFKVFGSNGVIGHASRSNAMKKSTIIGRVGSYCGSVYFTQNDCWVTDNAIIGEARENADGQFLYYLLKYLKLNNLRAGSGQPLLNQSILNSIKIPLAKKNEQQAIAYILGSLDDKIELNNQMNKTLEAIGQALFKRWFVDFEFPNDSGKPYKSSGGEMVYAEELGKEIPKGWKVGTIGDLSDVVGGSTPSTKDSLYWDEGIYHWVTPKDLSSLSSPVLLDTERKITAKGLSQISSGLLPVGTVLLSSRAPIGYLVVTEIPVAINQGFIAMKPKVGVSNLFLLYWASFAHEVILSMANGSTFLEISKSNFRPIKITVPSTTIMEKYDILMRPIYRQIVENARESRILISLRDNLLPKLMSGKIRVPIPKEARRNR